MSRIFPFRSLWRPAQLLAIGAGTCICTSSILVNGSYVRLDARPVLDPSSTPSRNRLRRTGISPEIVRQISNGSLAGLLAGLLTALFSRTLVFLGGAIALSFHFASKYGYDLSRLAGVGQVPGISALCQACTKKPWFTSSFAITYVLAAFVHL